MSRFSGAGFIVIMMASFPHVKATEANDVPGDLYGELLLRSENTSDLPSGRKDLNRTRLFLWLGFDIGLNDKLSFGASLYGNLGTDQGSNNRRNLDNSESNAGELDQLYLDWHFSENGYIRAGKQLIATKLSSLLWDKDINTLGGSFTTDWLDEQDSEYRMAAGILSVEHIFSDNSDLIFADFHYTFSLDDIFITTGLTAMHITNADNLSLDNVRRTNTDAALTDGFDIALVDLSLNFSLFSQPVVFGVETSQNFARSNDNKAYRVNFIVGSNAVEDGWQINLHYQDIERDAAVAAYVDDDWWFPTWMTGYRVSGSYGINNDTFVQVSYFDEKSRIYNTKRIFLELVSFF